MMDQLGEFEKDSLLTGLYSKDSFDIVAFICFLLFLLTTLLAGFLEYKNVGIQGELLNLRYFDYFSKELSALIT